MRFPLYFLLVILLACGRQRDEISSADYKIKDDLGTEFFFEKEPERIVTLAPNLTEFIYKLNLENKLIANTLYCNYPPEARRKPKAGDMISVDYEKIVALAPDLIFITVEGNSKGSYEKLKSLGYKVFVSNPRDYEGIKKTLSDIAFIFNKTDQAERIIKNWDIRLENILLQSKNRRKLSGMFAVSLNPIMLCGENTFMNEFLVYTGLYNIAAGSPMNYPVFSREKILSIDPDIMIFAEEKASDLKYLTDIYHEWKDLKAIKMGYVITVDPDLYFRPGPRFITALESLNEKITSLLAHNGSQ